MKPPYKFTRKFISVLFAFGSLVFVALAAQNDTGVSNSDIGEALSRLVYFEENAGQFHPSDVLYRARSKGYEVRLLKDRASMVVYRENEEGKKDAFVWNMAFENISPNAWLDPIKQLEAKFNYLRAENQSISASSYGEVFYRGVYPGIDLRYYNKDAGNIGYDFIVKPGVSPDIIRLRMDGIQSLRVDSENGELVMESLIGELRQSAPYTYQLIDGKKQEVESRFSVRNDGRVCFKLGKYDTAHAVIIDPTTLIAGTLVFGGLPNVNDNIYDLRMYDVEVTDDGVYICGKSDRAGVSGEGLLNTVPTTPGAIYPIHSGVRSGFVLKFSKDLSTLLMGTYINDNSNSKSVGVWDIEVDSSGFIYLAGSTHASIRDGSLTAGKIITTSNAFQTSIGGGFLQKLTPDGTDVIYGTYIGTPNWQEQVELKVKDGLMYALSYGEPVSSFGPLPTTPGAWQETVDSGVLQWMYLMIVDPNPALTNKADLKYCTYIAGTPYGATSPMPRVGHASVWHNSGGLDIDPSDGTIWVGSLTHGVQMPVTANALYPMVGNNSSRDSFLMQFAAISDLGNGASDVLYASGVANSSTADEGLTALQFGPDGTLYYVLECDQSSVVPLAGNPYKSAVSNSRELYIAAFDTQNKIIKASTFSGTTFVTFPRNTSASLAIDECGNPYIAETTNDEDPYRFPEDSYRPSGQGARSLPGYILRLSADLSELIDGTFVTGNANEDQSIIYGIFVKDGAIYGVGGFDFTVPYVFPTTRGAYIENLTEPAAWSMEPGYIVKFSTLYIKAVETNILICPSPASYTVSDVLEICGGESPYTYTWQADNPGNVVSINNADTLNPTISLRGDTVFTVSVKDAGGESYSKQINFEVAEFDDFGAGPDHNVCNPGDAVQIGLRDVKNATFSWSPTSTLDNPNSPMPTASPTVTTTYTLNYTDCDGRFESDTVIVYVNATPSQALSHFQDTYLACAAVPTKIGETGVDQYIYQWSPSDFLDNRNVAQPTVSALDSNVYTLTAISQCTGDRGSMTINLNYAPTSANAGEDKEVCRGAPVVVGNPPLNGISSYIWEFVDPTTPGSISSPGSAQTVVRINSIGTYELRLTASSTECGVTEDIMLVQVKPRSHTANAGQDRVLCVNWPSRTTWNPEAIGEPAIHGVSYTWTPTTGLDDPNTANPIVNPNLWSSTAPGASMTYTVRTRTDCDGHTSTDSVVVRLSNNRPFVDAYESTLFDPDQNNVLSQSPCNGWVIGMDQRPNVYYSWSPTDGIHVNTEGIGAYSVIANHFATGGQTITRTFTYPYSITVNYTNTVELTYTITNGFTGVRSFPVTKTVTVSTPITLTNSLTITNEIFGVRTFTVTNSYTLSMPYTVSHTFTATNAAAGTVLSYSQIFNEPRTYQEEYVYTYTYTVPGSAGGIKTYTLTATDMCSGLSASSSVTLDPHCGTGGSAHQQFDCTEAPIADAGPDVSICEGGSVQIGTPRPSRGSSWTYEWSPTLNLNNPNIPQPTVSSLAQGRVYNLLVTDPDSGVKMFDQVHVEVTPNPLSSAGNSPITVNNPATFTTVLGPAVGETQYENPDWEIQWEPAIGLSDPTALRPTLTGPFLSPTYTVRTKHRLHACFSEAFVVELDFTSCPILPINVGADRKEICQNTAAFTIGDVNVAPTWNINWTATPPSALVALSANNTPQVQVDPSKLSAGQVVIYTMTVRNPSDSSCVQSDSMTVYMASASTPTINLTAGSLITICAGADVTVDYFTVTPTDVPYTYSWTITGSGTIKSGETTLNPLITVSSGSATLTLTARNNCSGTSASRSVTLNTTSGPIINNMGTYNDVCPGTSVRLNPSISGSGLTYSWSILTGSGTLSSTSARTPTFTPSEASTLQLEVSNGRCTVSSTVSIPVLNPTADAGIDRTTCAGEAVTIGTSGDTTKWTYSWSVVSGDTGSLPSPANTPQIAVAPNSFTAYRLTVRDIAGRCAAKTDQVRVFISTSSPVAEAGPNKEICPGDSTGIGPETSISLFKYRWTPTVGLSNPSIANPSASPTNTTIYTLTVEGCTGVTATDTVQVRVQSAPTANAGADKTLCESSITTIGTPAVAGLTYSWSPATGLNQANIAQPAVTVPNDISTPLSITYTLSVDNGGSCQGKDTVTVTFNPDMKLSYPSQVEICTPGGSVTLGDATSVSGGVEPYTYLWNPATGLNNATLRNPVASPIVETTYTVTVFSANGITCGDTSDTVRVVAPAPTVTATTTAVCPGDTATLSATLIPGATYTWSGPNNYSASGRVQTISNMTLTQFGQYTVTATTFSGCVISDSVNLFNLCSCDIQITSATAGACVYNATTEESKSDLSVTVSWGTGAPPNEDIIVMSGGLSKTIDVSAVNSPATVVLTLPANGSNNLIVAQYEEVNECRAITNVVMPGPCSSGVTLTPRMMLQGSLIRVPETLPILMYDKLRSRGLLPATEPYSAMTSFTHVGGGGGETVGDTNVVFADRGSDSIVDWVFIELRDAANMNNVVHTRAALLQRDGDVVDVDGTSPLTFSSAVPASYYVSVRHRNHLGMMTGSAIALSAATTVVDFTDLNGSYWDDGSLIYAGASGVRYPPLGNVWALWGGNANADRNVIFTGETPDPAAIFNRVLDDPDNPNNDPEYRVHYYYDVADTTMDGWVIYTSEDNDTLIVFDNVLIHHPSNEVQKFYEFIIKEQLP